MNKYLKSAYRNLIKKRLFSLVNITSLTFGLVSALFIGTYVIYEFSYDKDIKDHQSVFRINNVYKGDRTNVIVPTADDAHPVIGLTTTISSYKPAHNPITETSPVPPLVIVTGN